MKLYVTEKPFSWMGKFTIQDIHGNDKYFAEGQPMSSGHLLHNYNAEKKEIAEIQNKFSGLSPKIFVRQNGTVTNQVVKKRSGFKSEIVIEGEAWKIVGNYSEHEFSLVGGYGKALVVKKLEKDGAVLHEYDISNTSDEARVLATALILDFILPENS
mgnify:CR=1 FL=1